MVDERKIAVFDRLGDLTRISNRQKCWVLGKVVDRHSAAEAAMAVSTKPIRDGKQTIGLPEEKSIFVMGTNKTLVGLTG